MTGEKIVLVVIFAIVIVWLLPALALTRKVSSMEDLDPVLKRQLIIPMWTIPLAGNLVCYFMFAKTGKLNPLSRRERLGIWIGGFMP